MPPLDIDTIGGIVFSNDDAILDLPPMSPSAGMDEIREYVRALHDWRQTREQLAGGGVLAKMVTFRDLVKLRLLEYGGSFSPPPPPPAGTGDGVIRLACSDLTSDIEPNPYAAFFRGVNTRVISGVRAALLDPGSTATEVQLYVNGVDMLGTTLTIDAGEKTSVTANVPATIAVSTIGNDIEVIAEILVAGTAARGLQVYLLPG